MKRRINFKKFTDVELVSTYKGLKKIIKVKNGELVVAERVLAKLPEPVINHVNSNREANTNPLHIAGLYGDLTYEMADRFVKQHS